MVYRLVGKYQMIVVDKLTDITSDLSDLEEFLIDAATIGVSVFELSTTFSEMAPKLKCQAVLKQATQLIQMLKQNG